MKKIIGVLIITTLVPLFSIISCTSVLDKNNLVVFGGDNVWTSETMTAAYLNNIYGALMPGGWPYNGSASDEGTDGSQGMNSFLRGIATIDSWNAYGYGTIDRINLFLSKIDGTPYTQEKIKQFKGEALFWRAWSYFNMVKGYGGVPLILGVQDYKNPEGLFVKRNKTSECFTQMVKDLDDAASLLPNAYTGADYGRIDKGVALAFKGKILLYYASPLFNPSNSAARWQAAYTATKTAKEFLESQGKGLYSSFKNIWYDERNKEVVMVNQYYKPDHYYSNAPIRPIFITKDAWGANEPTMFLVNSFPMKDGSEFDPSRPLAYDTLFKYRDDRFYATVAFNGAVYNTPDFKPGEKIWTGFATDGTSLEKIIHLNVSNAGRAGFWQIKGIDTNNNKETVHFGTVDWIEIRFAEVLMNYGEAANEAGKSAEALSVLYAIRQRAGILAGPGGNYGVTASSVSAIREAYIKERCAEFAFEGKRWEDLRRWRRFDILNTQQTRKAVLMYLKPGAATPVITDNIYDSAIWSRFTPKLIDNIDSPYTFNLLDKYYFYAIPKTHLDKNVNLEQNKDWGGTFDPLL